MANKEYKASYSVEGSGGKNRKGPLTSIKVIDFTAAVAGPYSGMHLTDLGADLIKVEPPWGDSTRNSLPSLTNKEAYGGYFQTLNRGKRSISLDITTEEGLEVVKKLVRDADVVMENFRSVEVTDKLGISYNDLKKINEKLIYASCKGYGNKRVMESPYAGRTTTDIVAQAMGGIMQVTGFPENGPTKVGPGIGDLFPGTLLTVGILSALVERNQSGKGQMVDVSMVDGILSLNDTRTVHHSYTGKDLKLPGNSHPYVFPMNVFDAVDGPVVIQANRERWHKLCEAIGKPELGEKYSEPKDRKENEEYLYDEINEWTKEHTREEIMELLHFTQTGPVYKASQQKEEEHFYARDMLIDVEHANTGESAKIAGQPVKHSRTTGRIQGRAPLLGEHSREILEEHGYETAKINSLFNSEVVFEEQP